MPEMPHSRKHHGNTMLIRRVDNFLVTHGTAGLNDSGNACVSRAIKTIAKREEGIRRHH